MKLKWMSIIALAGGLMLGGCSSENDIIDNADSETDSSKSEWTTLTISSEIENGDNIDLNTRSVGEIGSDGNPKNELPKGLSYYVNIYNGQRRKIKRKIFRTRMQKHSNSFTNLRLTKIINPMQ